MNTQQFYNKFHHLLSEGELFQIKMYRFLEICPEHIQDIISKYSYERKVDKPPFQVTITPKSKIALKNCADEIEPYISDRIRALKERSHIHSQLELVSSDEERYEICKRIREVLTPEIERLSKIITAFEENGTLPTVTTSEKAIRDETLKLVNKKRSLETDISNTEKRIRLSTDLTKKNKEETRLTRLKNELESVKRHLYD